MEKDGLLKAIQALDIDKVSKELTFKIGDVTFEMEPMAGYPAWELLEELRAEALGGLAISGLAKLLSLPPAFVKEKLIKNMASRTRFTTPDMTRGSLPFQGAENMNMALQPRLGVQPTAMYELLGRFIAINFPDLSKGIAKLFGSETNSSAQPL